MTVGQCGPLLGTRVYPTSSAPYYVEGQIVCAAFMFFVAALAIIMRFVCQWENKKLDRKYGRIEDLPSDTQTDGLENYGPRFRYVL